MDQAKSSNNFTDFNGNSPQVKAKVEDELVLDDGRIFYRCIYCNKVFPQKISRTFHMKKCQAKDYILTVADGFKTQDEPPCKKIIIQQNIPLVQPPKIDIKQNIVLSKAISPDQLKSVVNGTESSEHTDKVDESDGDDSSSDLDGDKCESLETMCKKCRKDFGSPLELLRHVRSKHTYPKVVMALSEIKKFYTVEDRSECPICHKPLKNKFRSAYLKHLHIHTNEMKYSCQVCNKRFRRADHMKAHEKRHVSTD